VPQSATLIVNINTQQQTSCTNLDCLSTNKLLPMIRNQTNYLFCECCSRCRFQPYDCVIIYQTNWNTVVKYVQTRRDSYNNTRNQWHSRKGEGGTSPSNHVQTRPRQVLGFSQTRGVFLSPLDPDPTTYTVSQKKQDTKLLPITLPNIGRFTKFFHC